jgi:non-specific serine/threonine protein kinase
MLNFFWYGCGAAREGRLWLERALAADLFPSKDRVRALVVYGRVLISCGLHAEGAEPARECLELARWLGDPALLAEALGGRGLNLMYTGDLPAALPLLDEAIERAAAIPDAAFPLAIATCYRGVTATADGDPVRADVLMAQSRAACRAAGDLWFLDLVLAMSIPPALMIGAVAQAAAYGRESLSGSAVLGDTLGLTVSLELLAWTAAADGDHGRAARLLGAAGQQAVANGGIPFTAGQFGAAHGQCVAAARAALGDDRFGAEFGAGAQLTLEDAIAHALGDGPAQKPQPALAALVRADELPQLTKREFEIAQLIAEGLTNKQIADQLVISRRTAEGHVEHILTKLGFTTRTQIASWLFARQTADAPGNGRRLPGQ